MAWCCCRFRMCPNGIACTNFAVGLELLLVDAVSGGKGEDGQEVATKWEEKVFSSTQVAAIS